MSTSTPYPLLALFLVASAIASCGGEAPNEPFPEEDTPPSLPIGNPPSPRPSPETPAEGGGVEGFDVALRFLSPVDNEVRQAFEAARARWSMAIVNDLTDARVRRSNLAADCGGTPVDEILDVDDLFIFVEVEDIDGPGGVLGAAGPCVLRADGGAPIVGIMRFDAADLDGLLQVELLETVILHEMGHVLGIGTLWDLSGLLANPSLPASPGVDTHFVGPEARAAFVALGGTGGSGSIVPVENRAQPGSSDGHWRESVLGSELMSPRVSPREGFVALSLLTLASLEDLGFYQVDRSVADPFTVGETPSLAVEQGLVMEGCHLHRPSATLAPPKDQDDGVWVSIQSFGAKP